MLKNICHEQIEVIKPKADGLEIKLTSKGLLYGSSVDGSRRLGEFVKAYLIQNYREAPPVSASLIAIQIYAHCEAYMKCSWAENSLKNSKNKLYAPGASLNVACSKSNAIKRANPINTSWIEITDHYALTKNKLSDIIKNFKK